MLGKKNFRAQSAMEYLMTYGWAILIIAVVLGALFSLGIFGGSGLVGTACVASPGYLCSGPTLNSNGELSFQFGQNTGSPIYNIEFACDSLATSSGLPANAAAWSPVDASGAAVANTTTPDANAFVSGQTLSVSGLPCYDGSTGITPLGSSLNPAATKTATIGASYSGYLWLNYTAGSGAIGSGNPWYTVKMATISLKVV